MTAHPAATLAMPDLSFRVGTLTLSAPVMPASGCFGPELGRLIAAAEVAATEILTSEILTSENAAGNRTGNNTGIGIGASVTKTVFASERGGNPVHRVSEVAAGMVNSVGIPSRGSAGYIASQHPAYVALGIPTIISVGAHRPADYAPLVAQLAQVGDAYELNVSCPNLERDSVAIGADPHTLERVVAAVRAMTHKPLIVKLPSMLSSVAECAIAAEVAGADALCVANSLPALAFEPQSGRPALGNLIGGLSGPSIRPIVLRLVWLASRAVSIPVIGCGGISSTADALEYFSVGASAVQIGTASFAEPVVMSRITRELAELCLSEGVQRVTQLSGARLVETR